MAQKEILLQMDILAASVLKAATSRTLVQIHTVCRHLAPFTVITVIHGSHYTKSNGNEFFKKVVK